MVVVKSTRSNEENAAEEENEANNLASKKLLRSSAHDSFDLEILEKKRREDEVAQSRKLESLQGAETARRRGLSRFVRGEKAAEKVLEEAAASQTVQSSTADAARGVISDHFIQLRRAASEREAKRETLLRQQEISAAEAARGRVRLEIERDLIKIENEREAARALDLAHKCTVEADALEAKLHALKTGTLPPSPKRKSFGNRTHKKGAEKIQVEKTVPLPPSPSRRALKLNLLAKREEEAARKRKERKLAVVKAQQQARKKRLDSYDKALCLREALREKNQQQLLHDKLKTETCGKQMREQRNSKNFLSSCRRACQKAENAARDATNIAARAAENARLAALRPRKLVRRQQRQAIILDKEKAQEAAKCALAAEASKAAHAAMKFLEAAAVAAQKKLEEEETTFEATLVHDGNTVVVKVPTSWGSKPAARLIDVLASYGLDLRCRTCQPRLQTGSGIPLDACTVHDAIRFAQGVIAVVTSSSL